MTFNREQVRDLLFLNIITVCSPRLYIGSCARFLCFFFRSLRIFAIAGPFQRSFHRLFSFCLSLSCTLTFCSLSFYRLILPCSSRSLCVRRERDWFELYLLLDERLIMIVDRLLLLFFFTVWFRILICEYFPSSLHRCAHVLRIKHSSCIIFQYFPALFRVVFFSFFFFIQANWLYSLENVMHITKNENCFDCSEEWTGEVDFSLTRPAIINAIH